MQTVLSTPELLETIFLELDNKCNEVNSSVCRQWNTVVDNIIWRRLDHPSDFIRLLRSLAPVKKLYDGKIVFVETTSPPTWEKFQQRSHRVQSISFFPPSNKYHNFVETFKFLAQARPCFNLFPNLTNLECYAGRHEIGFHLFMFPNVKRLEIMLLEPSAIHSIYYICRMPLLTSLEISGPTSSLNELLEYIPTFQQLETIILPAYNTNGDIVQKLSHLPRLRHIISKLSFSYGHIVIPYQGFHLTLEICAFPVLQTLSITADSGSLLSFMQHQPLPKCLRALYISLPKHPNITSLVSFLKDIASVTELEELTIYGYPLYHAGNPDMSTISWRGEIDTNLPLALPKLTVLDIYLDNMHDWTVASITELAHALPMVEKLLVNVHKVYNNYRNRYKPQITLDVLPIFSRNCPRLRHLGLPLDGTLNRRHTVDIDPFPELRSLHVGYSVPDSTRINDIAVFLARILPPSCTIIEPGMEEWGSVITLLLPLRSLQAIFEYNTKKQFHERK